MRQRLVIFLSCRKDREMVPEPENYFLNKEEDILLLRNKMLRNACFWELFLYRWVVFFCFFFFQKAIEKDTNAAFTKQGHKDSWLKQGLIEFEKHCVMFKKSDYKVHHNAMLLNYKQIFAPMYSGWIRNYIYLHILGLYKSFYPFKH